MAYLCNEMFSTKFSFIFLTFDGKLFNHNNLRMATSYNSNQKLQKRNTNINWHWHNSDTNTIIFILAYFISYLGPYKLLYPENNNTKNGKWPILSRIYVFGLLKYDTFFSFPRSYQNKHVQWTLSNQYCVLLWLEDVMLGAKILPYSTIQKQPNCTCISSQTICLEITKIT